MSTPPRPVALVTGSGKKRLGYFVAESLATRGYDLVIHYRSSASEADDAKTAFEHLGARVLSVQADLSNEADVSAMFSSIRTTFGRLDLVINCAAIWNRKPLETTTAADVREHFETNTLGTFLCCQQGGLWMVKQPTGGVIINFGDWAEVRPYRDYAAYFPSKGAVTTLTRTFAVELGHRNPKVRVNCIMPGPVLLPPDMTTEEREEVINATLTKTEGGAEAIIRAVWSFVENPFLTGVCLPVDGGRTVFAPE